MSKKNSPARRSFLAGLEDFARFTLRFLQQPHRVASIIPSSGTLARNMMVGLDFDAIRTVAEFGPGVGTFTDLILANAKHDDLKVLLLELDPVYVAHLRKKYADEPRVIVEHDSAGNLEEALERNGLSDRPLDAIVSGLPTPSISKPDMVKINALLRKHTAKGTKFRMFTYMPDTVVPYYGDLGLVRFSKTWRNFPPAYVLGVN